MDRKITAEHTVSLDKINGSGPGGRIVREDVLTEVERGQIMPLLRPTTGPLPVPSSPSPPIIPTAAPSPASQAGSGAALSSTPDYEVPPLSGVWQVVARA